METRNEMPVWAPSHEELNEIERRVRQERAAAPRGFFKVMYTAVIG